MGNSVPKFVTNSCDSVKEKFQSVKNGYEGIKQTIKVVKSVYNLTRSFETSKFAETNDPNDIIDAIYKTESDIPGKYKELLKVIPADTLKKVTNIMFESLIKSRGAYPSPKDEGQDRPAADTKFPIPDLTTKENVSEAIGRMTDAITGTYDRTERDSRATPQNWSSQPDEFSATEDASSRCETRIIEENILTSQAGYVHPNPPTSVNDNPEYSEMKSDDDRDSGFGNLNDNNEEERGEDSGPFGMQNENINYQQTPNYENQPSFDSVETSNNSSEANRYYKPESDNSFHRNQTEESQKGQEKEIPPLTKKLGEELQRRFGPEWRKRVPSFVHEPTDSVPDLGFGLGKEQNRDNAIEMYANSFDLGHQERVSLCTEQDKTYRSRSNNEYDDHSLGITSYYAPQDKITDKSDQPTESCHNFADQRDNFTDQNSKRINIPFINQSSPPFQVEYGIYISELMKESNLILEELRLYENRAECNVRKKNGQLKKIIVERDPQAPCQFPIGYAILNEKGSLVKTSESQFRFIDRKSSNATPARYGPFQPVIKSFENNLNNIPKIENPLPVKNSIKSNYKGSSSGDGFPGFYFAHHDKPSRQYSIFKSSDLSLYEETRQFKIGDDTTVERYQRYKVRPTAYEFQKVAESQRKESEKAVIDPKVSLDEQGYIKKQNEPGMENKIEQNNENYLPYKLTYVTSPDGIRLRLEKDVNITENNLKYLEQNQSGWATNKGTTQESSFFQQRAVVPHITFTKPRVRRLLSNNIKRFVFSKKSEIKVSASNIKSTSSERLSNISSFAELETCGHSKTNDTCSENTGGYKKAVFNRKFINETRTGTTKYLPVKSESEDDTTNSYKVQNSAYYNNQVGEGNSMAVLKTDENSHLQDRVLGIIPKGRHGSSVKIKNKDDRPISSFFDIYTRRTEGSYDIKNENGSYEPIAYKTNDEEIKAEVQQENETILNITDVKEPTFNRSSLHASQSHTRDENYKLLINNLNSLAENKVTKRNAVCKLSTQISCDEIESIGLTDEPVSLIIEAAPKINTTEGEIHQIGYSLETKDQKLARLQDQIGKVSLTNERAPLPISGDVLMTQSINNSDSYKEKRTPSLIVEENLVKRQSSISNWNYQTKGEDGEEKTRVTTQFQSNTVVNEEREMKKMESKSEDRDQCSIM